MDIRDIAKRAGVSTATVSRTINRVPTVAPQLAKRVWKTIDELGYYPNTQARALVSGRTKTFGLIVSEITNPFFPTVIQVFEHLALQHGYEILLSSTVHDPERMKVAVRRMIERRVDGVAILTFGMEESLLEDLRLRNVPLAFVDVGPARPGVINIRIDYEHGITQAVQHLASLGHKKIAFIAGPPRVRSAVARKQAFVSAMQHHQLKVERRYLVTGDHTSNGGMTALQSLLALKQRPSAVLCSNDLTAIGVMRQAHHAGLKIPEDLSVIGFDNIWLSDFLVPPLTTVQMSQTELAEVAFHALLTEAQREDHPLEGSQYRLTTSLLLRSSTAPVRNH
jgi:DNA-binding LacI/PurR family transcriptional regulator